MMGNWLLKNCVCKRSSERYESCPIKNQIKLIKIEFITKREKIWTSFESFREQDVKKDVYLDTKLKEFSGNINDELTLMEKFLTNMKNIS